MNNKFSLGGVFAVVGCCLFGWADDSVMTAVSPDGRNEILLWTNPLAYEVRRDRTMVVAKSEIGMSVDGKGLSDMKRSEDGFPAWERRSLTGNVETPVYKKTRIDLAGNKVQWGLSPAGARG